MKRYRVFTFAGIAGLVLLASATAHAQPPSMTPYQKPTVSPYLNLLRPGSTGLNYHTLVRPQLDLDRSVHDLQRSVYQPPTAQPSILPPTGHSAGFMTYGHRQHGNQGQGNNQARNRGHGRGHGGSGHGRSQGYSQRHGGSGVNRGAYYGYTAPASSYSGYTGTTTYPQSPFAPSAYAGAPSGYGGYAANRGVGNGQRAQFIPGFGYITPKGLADMQARYGGLPWQHAHYGRLRDPSQVPGMTPGLPGLPLDPSRLDTGIRPTSPSSSKPTDKPTETKDK